MKLDRLLAITMMLVEGGRMSAPELARRFEVSVRTIHRDIEAINLAGIPIVSHPGQGGGYSILDTYKVSKGVLTPDEIASIRSALRGVNTVIDDSRARTALEKVSCLMPPDDPASPSPANYIVLNLSPGGGNRREREKINLVKTAIERSLVITFSYTSTKGESVERAVEPMSLVLVWQHWYLYGYCRLRDDYRLFRFSRMKNLRVTSDRFVRREKEIEETELDQEWSGGEMVDIVLRFTARVATRVHDMFDAENTRRLEDGSVEVAVRYPDEEWVQNMILSYADDVEVVSPSSLRKAVRDKAAAVVEKYSSKP